MARSLPLTDPYLALGVPRGASAATIEQAYRRIAMKDHPDNNPGDAEAATRFIRASRAYAVLVDPDRRLSFDRTGIWDDDGRVDDPDARLLEAARVIARSLTASDWDANGRPQQILPPFLTVPVEVTFEEVEHGGRRRVTPPCADCAGTGLRPGAEEVPCAGCAGSGRRSGAEPVDVRIPRGVAEGDPVATVTADGIRLVARTVEDARWTRDGADLYVTTRLPYELAVLGGTLDLELPARTYPFEVAAGIESGEPCRIPGEGLPRQDDEGRGDLIVIPHVAVPQRIGPLERWFLETRRLGSDDGPVRGLRAHLCHLQRVAWLAARNRWSRWRDRQHGSTVRRIEKVTAGLRFAARLVNESQGRLGSLVQEGFRLIAPETSVARHRFQEYRKRPSHSKRAALMVDAAVVAVLGAAVWVGGTYAAPAVAAVEGGAWWQFLQTLHPASLAVGPVAAGLMAGTLRAMTTRHWIPRLVTLPLVLMVVGVAAATASFCYAFAVQPFGGTRSITLEVLSATLAIAVSVTPFILFLLGSTLAETARAALVEAEDRRNRRVLLEFDATAARLTEQLDDFRHFVAKVHEVRQPLTSLLDQAAGTLAREKERASASTREAVLAMASGIAITALWIGAAALAVGAAFILPPDPTPTWVRLAAAATVAALCALGCFLPARTLQRHRSQRITAILATVGAGVALAGILSGAGGVGPGSGWFLLAGSIAALALSFRLTDSLGATRAAAEILLAGAVAVILWPLAVTLRSGKPAGGSDHDSGSTVPRF